MFCAQLFNFGIIFALIIFEKTFASKVCTFTFCCIMPGRSHVGKICHPYEWVKYVAVACSVRLWDRGHSGSLWVHPSALINIMPGSGNINTTIQNPKGWVFPITVSRYGWLVEVDDGWLNIGARPILCVGPEWVCNAYQEFYRSSFFSRQRDLIWLFHTSNQINSDTFPKRSGR